MNNDYNKTISGSSGVNFDGITIGGGITPYNNTIDTNTTRTSSNNQSGNTSTLDLECFITDNLDETVTEKTVDKGTGNIGTIGDLSKLDLSNFSSYTLIYNQSISICENKIKELEKELDALISVAKDWYSLYPSLDIDKNNLSELIDYYLKSNNSDYESYEYYISEIQKLNEDIDILNTNLDNLVSYYANQKGITIEAATKELMGQTIPSLQNMTITQREEYLNELLYEQRQIYENYQAEYNSKYRNGVVFLSDEERKSFINVAIYLQSLNIFDRVGIEPHHIYELTGQVDGLQSERLIKLIDYCTNIHLTNDDLKLIALEWGEDYAAEFLENRDLNIFDCISEYLDCCENGYEEWAWDFSGLAAYTATNSYAYVSENEFKHSIGENKITYEEFQADLAIVFNEDGIISRAQEKEQMEQDLLQMQITIYNLEQAAKLLPYEAVADNHDFEIADDYSSYPHIANKSLIDDQILTNREIAIYDYLYQRNPSDAYAYLEALQDTINRRKGMQQAVEFIENMTVNGAGIEDFFIAGWEGFKDGNINFFDGCIDFFTADGVVSDFEYAMMYKAMLLSGENNEYNQYLPEEYRMFLSMNYSTMSSIGNMMIPSLVGLVNPTIGTGLMMWSTAGNSTEQAMQNGASGFQAYLYGSFVGVSEGALERILGGIPGLSNLNGSFVKNMLSEGAEEMIQTWLDAGLRATILGEEIDLTATFEESVMSGLQGMLVSGLMQGGTNISFKIGNEIVYWGPSDFNSLTEIINSIQTKGNAAVADLLIKYSGNSNVHSFLVSMTLNSDIITDPKFLNSLDNNTKLELMETASVLGYHKIAEYLAVDMANNTASSNESRSTNTSSNIDGTIESLYSKEELFTHANDALANNNYETLLNALDNMSIENRIEYIKSIDDSTHLNNIIKNLDEVRLQETINLLTAEEIANIMQKLDRTEFMKMSHLLLDEELCTIVDILTDGKFTSKLNMFEANSLSNFYTEGNEWMLANQYKKMQLDDMLRDWGLSSSDYFNSATGNFNRNKLLTDLNALNIGIDWENQIEFMNVRDEAVLFDQSMLEYAQNIARTNRTIEQATILELIRDGTFDNLNAALDYLGYSLSEKRFHQEELIAEINRKNRTSDTQITYNQWDIGWTSEEIKNSDYYHRYESTISSERRQQVLAEFLPDGKKGKVYAFQGVGAFNRFMVNNHKYGRTEGAYVISESRLIDVLSKACGLPSDVRLTSSQVSDYMNGLDLIVNGKKVEPSISSIEKDLGFDPGYFSNGVILTECPATSETLRWSIPTDSGANNLYNPGLSTSGGTNEMVVSQVTDLSMEQKDNGAYVFTSGETTIKARPVK